MPMTSELREVQEFEQPSNGRRGGRLLGYLTTALLAAAGMGEVHADERTDLVKTYVENFPKAEEFPHIQVVKKDAREGARHILIHMRMMHWHPFEDNPESNEKVRICQTQWKKALEAMINDRRIQLKAVYAEGIIANNSRLYSKPLDVDAIIMNHNTVPPPPPLPVTIADKEAQITDQNRTMQLPLLIKGGADYELQAQGKLSLLAVEFQDVKDLTWEAQYEGWHDIRTYMFDRREDAALEIMVGNDDPGGFVFYGAAHDWRDNIDRWNEAHPDHAFSLIEMTPDCLIDDVTGELVLIEHPDDKPIMPIVENDVKIAAKTE